ncbi:hypothetical protein KVR01_004864 [Diaporthe batatas]|uniref:uncharacterized protein n=1 Tax=Diaporthe batatas TaxID=748121 RepID=UPI001D053059|nr:uncharacterized protein KVR01_004864 [Diaporthe batatas]KAG8164589.1 hypothetical protein KVR01_004864 [Diaporthe batatas]
MHQSVLLVAAGLICPVFAVPNANNRVNLRKGHRQRQLQTSIVSVGAPASVGPYKPPFYGPPPPNVSIATVTDSTTSPPDSTSACSVIRITEYVTVYGTGASSAASPVNATSAPSGWNSSTSAVTTTSEPFYPISNSTTATSFGTGTGEVSVLPTFANTTSILPTFLNTTSILPTFINTTSILPTFINTTLILPTFVNTTSILPTAVNLTTTVDYTLAPNPYPTPVVVPSNFTSFPNISTPDVSITVLPTAVLPTFSTSVLVNTTSFANVTAVPLPTVTEETTTTIIIPPFSTSSSASLVINPSQSPIEVAPSTSTTTTGLVIVTSVPPIDTASATPSELPTTVVTATNTVSDNAPTGTPSPDEIHCGVRGSALGVYYLATYAYNKAGVPVTLEGCYQFCSFAIEQCYSYEFYLEPGLGAPRCKLYGGIVAYELASIDPYSPDLWFDVACGDPSKYIGAK